MTTSIAQTDLHAAGSESQKLALPPTAPPAGLLAHTIWSRFLFLTLCIAIVLSALAYGTVHYWALAIFDLGAVLLGFLWLADGLRLGSIRMSRNALQLPIFGMLLLGLFQLLPLRSIAGAGVLSTAGKTSLSLDPNSTRLVLVQFTALLIYFSATLVFVDSPHRLRILVRTITIFGFALALFGMTQSFTAGNKVYWVGELEQSVAFGPFINRHHFAGYMELTIALPLGLLFSGAIKGEKRLLYIFAAVLMGMALILTNSRGGIISLIAEIFFLALFSGVRRRRNAEEENRPQQRARDGIVRASLALLLVLGLIGGAALFGGEQALSRFVGTVNTDDPSTGRAHFWNVTLDIIRANPLVGAGLGSFGVVYTRYDSRNGLFRLEQAHNDYLQVLADSGVIGAALGLFFIVALFRVGFLRRERNERFRRGVALGALSGCFAVLVHSFFDFTLHTTANALLFLILAALATLNGRVEHHQHRRRHREEPAA